MEIIISEKAQKDILYWKKTNNFLVQKLISELKDAIIENPYIGIGKPEPLKHKLSGKWSRRIDKVNRFIYDIQDNKFNIYSLKGHYD
jgi:toxin YoeB